MAMNSCRSEDWNSWDLSVGGFTRPMINPASFWDPCLSRFGFFPEYVVKHQKNNVPCSGASEDRLACGMVLLVTQPAHHQTQQHHVSTTSYGEPNICFSFMPLPSFKRYYCIIHLLLLRNNTTNHAKYTQFLFRNPAYDCQYFSWLRVFFKLGHEIRRALICRTFTTIARVYSLWCHMTMDFEIGLNVLWFYW